jgi:hypothetical protein
MYDVGKNYLRTAMRKRGLQKITFGFSVTANTQMMLVMVCNEVSVATNCSYTTWSVRVSDHSLQFHT